MSDKVQKGLAVLLSVLMLAANVPALAQQFNGYGNGQTYTIVLDNCAAGHDWGRETILKKPTCTSRGEAQHTCSRCGTTETYKTNTAPHKYGEWYVVTDPGEYTAGKEARVCSACDKVQERNLYPEGTLMRDDKGDEVRLLQQNLNDAGYDVGKPDGKFGQRTENGIKAYQTAMGLTSDGIAWPALQALLSHDWSEWVTLTEATDHSKGIEERKCIKVDCGKTEQRDIYPEGTLMYDDRSDSVKALQEALNANGFSCGRPDGYFGRQTENAVKQAQKAAGMEQDGIAWPSVLKILGVIVLGEIDVDEADIAPTATLIPAITAEPTATLIPAITAEPTPDPAPTSETVLFTMTDSSKTYYLTKSTAIPGLVVATDFESETKYVSVYVPPASTPEPTPELTPEPMPELTPAPTPEPKSTSAPKSTPEAQYGPMLEAPAATPMPTPKREEESAFVPCYRGLQSTGDNGETHVIHFCDEHALTQQTVKELVSKASTSSEQTAAWMQAVALWRAEIDKLYKTLQSTADAAAQADFAAECTSFYASAASHEMLLHLLYPDDASLVASMMAETMENKCITLCYEIHTAPGNRADGFAHVSSFDLDLPCSEECTQSTTVAKNGDVQSDQRLCARHAAILQIRNLLLDGSESDGEALASIAQLWRNEVNSGYSNLHALGNVQKAAATAALKTFENHLVTREKALLALYGRPEIANEVIAQMLMERATALCSLK